jgi:chemotaxis protein CheC
MSEFANHSEEDKDMLREIGNIGSGNALTSLSIILKSPLTLGLPDCRVLKKESAGQLLSDPGNMYAGAAISVSGAVDCLLFLLLNREFTRKILSNLDPDDAFDVMKLTEDQKSALEEVVNIMGGSYMTAVGTLLGGEMTMTVPKVSVGRGEVILGKFLDEYMAGSRDFLFIKTPFTCGNKKLESYMLLCPTEKSLDDLIRRLC